MIADDVYVHHGKSKSFGDAARDELTAKGIVALRAKHGDERIQEALIRTKEHQDLVRLRKRFSQALYESL